MSDSVRANLHLRVLNQDRTIGVEVPQGPVRLADLLPAARALCNEMTAAAVEDARRQGKTISCRAGCGACCRQLVPISLVEAQSLAELVASMPHDRQRVIRSRFAAAVARLESAGLLDPAQPRGHRGLLFDGSACALDVFPRVHHEYFRHQIPCPFLENESCGIHPDRPLVCREYHVTTSPDHCAAHDAGRVNAVKPPLQMGDVLCSAASRLTGLPALTIPLILSLEWAEAHAATLDRIIDGDGAFRTLLSELDRRFERAFDARSDGG